MLTFVKRAITDNILVYNLYRGVNHLGGSTIGVDISNQQAHIYSIKIGDLHQGKLYGSNLMHYIETDMTKIYNIKTINLLAYQQPFDRLEQFYIKNGYIRYIGNDNTKQQYHDDGDHIYDIIHMVKNIST